MSVPIGGVSVVFLKLFGTVLQILESWIPNNVFQMECWKYFYGVFEKINSQEKKFPFIKINVFQQKE